MIVAEVARHVGDHRHERQGVVHRFLLGENLAVVIETRDDPGVSPEIRDDQLQARYVGAELADRRALRIPDLHVAHDLVFGVYQTAAAQAAPDSRL